MLGWEPMYHGFLFPVNSINDAVKLTDHDSRCALGRDRDDIGRLRIVAEERTEQANSALCCTHTGPGFPC